MASLSEGGVAPPSRKSSTASAAFEGGEEYRNFLFGSYASIHSLDGLPSSAGPWASGGAGAAEGDAPHRRLTPDIAALLNIDLEGEEGGAGGGGPGCALGGGSGGGQGSAPRERRSSSTVSLGSVARQLGLPPPPRPQPPPPPPPRLPSGTGPPCPTPQAGAGTRPATGPVPCAAQDGCRARTAQG